MTHIGSVHGIVVRNFFGRLVSRVDCEKKIRGRFQINFEIRDNVMVRKEDESNLQGMHT